jgi:vacuolar-type H+-ATPase subunit I/STV1
VQEELLKDYWEMMLLQHSLNKKSKKGITKKEGRQMSLEKIDQYIKELEAIKNYNICRQILSDYKSYTSSVLRNNSIYLQRNKDLSIQNKKLSKELQNKNDQILVLQQALSRERNRKTTDMKTNTTTTTILPSLNLQDLIKGTF